jgi:hypothetical protein
VLPSAVAKRSDSGRSGTHVGKASPSLFLVSNWNSVRPFGPCACYLHSRIPSPKAMVVHWVNEFLVKACTRSVVLQRGTSSLVLGQVHREHHLFLLRNIRETYTTECDTTLVKLGNVLMLIIFLALTIELVLGL